MACYCFYKERISGLNHIKPQAFVYLKKIISVKRIRMETEKKQQGAGSQDAGKPEDSSQWVRKAEEMIDDAAEKIHQSELYRETGKVMESATKKLFRQAGKLWGKSEHYFKK